MHWVNRGREPMRLKPVCIQYTPRWIQYYRYGVGSAPKDSHWRRFLPDLRSVFRNICAYCEERAKGEVDHFRPKSQYPELVYFWSNWLFTCRDCNQAKANKWPAGGYVDPSARSTAFRPDNYFCYDTQTGEILPNMRLSHGRSKKAQRTIEDLRMNDLHHLKNRRDWLRLISALLPDVPANLTTGTEAEIAHFASRSAPLSSITRAFLCEQGYRKVSHPSISCP